MSLLCSIFLSLSVLHLSSLSTTPQQFVCCLATASNLYGNKTDYQALIAIKSKIINDPYRVTSSWNDSLHFCEWQGITCGHRHRRVVVLDLQSLSLVGSLSPYVGNLSFLKVISLSNNSFHGEIPHSIGNLFRLQSLNMENNSLEGKIPSNLSHCNNLKFLYLPRNKLVGKIPAELSFLSLLNDLDLSKNYLTGEEATFFANLSSLQVLGLNNIYFGGRIPDVFGNLKSLKELRLGWCNFSGTIPPSIYNLSLLTYFYVANNQLHGNLPVDVGLALSHLQRLVIWGNQFTGPIPVSLSNASQLEYIEMSNNYFTGKVLVNFGGLQHLWHLSLNENQLGNGDNDDLSFLISLVNCSELRMLGLYNNRFGGVLPNSIVNLSTTIKLLVIAENQIFGSIPSDIGNLVNLNTLGLFASRLTGRIPESIGKLQKMQNLCLFENKLTGPIPTSIGNLTLLIQLFLQDNNLNGSIPMSLGKCQDLLVLNLSGNNLAGTIPKEIFGISSLSISLDLSHNQLTGSLPLEVSDLVHITELVVSENKLTGEIPSSLRSCTSLERMYMEGNLFQGPFPSSFTSLRGLQDVDLSRNNLSSQIPKYLENFALKNLNLSFNDFEGEVPLKGIFNHVSPSSFAGNKRLCGGRPELQLPNCTIKEAHKLHALKMVISIACALVGVTVAISLFLFFSCKRKIEEPRATSSVEKSFMRVSYEMLLKATGGFSSANLIGVGSFGSVYQGILDPEEMTIAVKVLNLQHRGAQRSFLTECEALRNLRHRNLVKIISACSSIDFQGNDFKALVYKFMPNGSLERWLHSIPNSIVMLDGPKTTLNLLQRLNIAIDVACALEYLHHHCQPPIIHCDLKPSNILLDSEMTGHVSDFGIARFLLKLNNSSIQSSSLGVRGTIGYTPPEYGLGGEVSTYGDVYSFGIMLLEMFTGKRPTDSMFEEGLNLHHYGKRVLPDRVIEIVDQTLCAQGQRREDKIEECLTLIIRIGVTCSLESPQQRMGIINVVNELCSIRDILRVGE